MKKILRFSQGWLVNLILCTSIIFMNFSFVVSKQIVVEGFHSPEDGKVRYGFGDIADHEVKIGEITVLTGADSCKVSFWYHGYGWRDTTLYPTTMVTVELREVMYVLPPQLVLESRTKKSHKDFRLRFLAVSAPFWVSSAGNPESYRLDSRTPFSLQNAIRLGAEAARAVKGPWGISNWSDRELLRDSVFLLNYFEEDAEYFEAMLESVEPQILFLGSMTLSFPGAVRLASIAKQTLGENVFIVLGGKHVNETIYLRDNAVRHHVGSPTLLMQQGHIPHVFDLVVSGDGEEVVQHIGECLGEKILTSGHVKQFSVHADSFKDLRGKFILSWVENGEVRNLSSAGTPLDYDSLPSPVSLFGVNTNFPVFGTQYTAHVYSDMGKGCAFNCFFCSERNMVNGKVLGGNPALRLHKQLRDAAKSGSSMSAFVEDSILLTGSPLHLNRLADLLESQPVGIPFGGQFTVDNLLDPEVQQGIARLAKCGLCYVYTGMETSDEAIARGFSKNTHRGSSWVGRNEKAIKFLSDQKIKYGVSLLWGLGESREERERQLDFLSTCKERYGIPVVFSVNCATQHPLFDQSTFDFIGWGTERNSAYLPVLVRMFGEASEKYVFPDAALPPVSELLDLERKFRALMA
jgi:B12-binding domain/radical SAM domain protein